MNKNKTYDRRLNSAKKINNKKVFNFFNNNDNKKLDIKLNLETEKIENSNEIQKNNFINLESGKTENKNVRLYKNNNSQKNKNFYSLILEFKKICIVTQEIYVKKDNIIFLEIKIPNNQNNKYDTIKIYHRQGSKIEDKNNLINLNQTITHKIFFDEKNITNFKQEKIFIYFHKIEKKTENKKNISIDRILGYSRFTLGRCFLNKENSFSGKFNIIEKERKNNKNNKKLNIDNFIGDNEELKNNKNKNVENKYDKNGERIIGCFEISVHLK